MSITMEDSFDNGDWVCHVYSTYAGTDNMLGRVIASDYDVVTVEWDMGRVGTYKIDEIVRPFWI